MGSKSLESRAALYAGSIAKYGTVQLDGLVGIPASDAATYYQLSLNASAKIIAEGGYSLFNNYSDPAKIMQIYLWMKQMMNPFL